MVSTEKLVHIDILVNNCIESSGYDAVLAFSKLNRYISELRKQYKENLKHVRD